MSKAIEVEEEKTTTPMQKDGVEIEVSNNPAGRKILAKQGWKEIGSKK